MLCIYKICGWECSGELFAYSVWLSCSWSLPVSDCLSQSVWVNESLGVSFLPINIFVPSLWLHMCNWTDLFICQGSQHKPRRDYLKMIVIYIHIRNISSWIYMHIWSWNNFQAIIILLCNKLWTSSLRIGTIILIAVNFIHSVWCVLWMISCFHTTRFVLSLMS